MPRGMLGLVPLQEAETLGQRGPTQRRRHYHPQLLSWWLGPEITRWWVNIHFCVKDVSLVWGRLFLLSRRQWWPTTVLLPGKTQEQRGLVGCSPWGRLESDTTERLHIHFSLSWTGEGNCNPLQYSCMENLRDGGAWWDAIYRVAQNGHDWSDLAKQQQQQQQQWQHLLLK